MLAVLTVLSLKAPVGRGRALLDSNGQKHPLIGSRFSRRRRCSPPFYRQPRATPSEREKLQRRDADFCFPSAVCLSVRSLPCSP